MTTALNARYYVDPEFEATENERIFRTGWQLLGRMDQFKQTGDRVVGAIGNLPVVLVRDEAGEIRGFHNVCRHRAGPVAVESGPGSAALACAYHGWTYGLDGRLKRAPDMPACPCFDPDTTRLPELKSACWQGLVFAADQPAMAFPELTSGIDERLAGRDFSQLAFHRRVEYTAQCNWKVYVDNFLEGYHLPRVHPALNRLLDYKSYRTETGRWHSLQWSPMESDGNPYGPGDALYYFLWPNTMLNILPDRLQTNQVIAGGVDACRIVFEYFYTADTEPETVAEDEAISDQTQREDIAICEAVQRGMASGSWEAGPLNPDHETGVAHFQALYRRALAAGSR